jgi:hypothetical protein
MNSTVLVKSQSYHIFPFPLLSLLIRLRPNPTSAEGFGFFV